MRISNSQNLESSKFEILRTLNPQQLKTATIGNLQSWNFQNLECCKFKSTNLSFKYWFTWVCEALWFGGALISCSGDWTFCWTIPFRAVGFPMDQRLFLLLANGRFVQQFQPFRAVDFREIRQCASLLLYVLDAIFSSTSMNWHWLFLLVPFL